MARKRGMQYIPYDYEAAYNKAIVSQDYRNVVHELLKDIKGKRQETEELTEGKVQTRGAEHVPLSCGRQYISLRIWENGDLVM